MSHVGATLLRAIAAAIVVVTIFSHGADATAVDALINNTIVLSSPLSLALSSGANMNGSGQVRVFFAPDGNRFISTYNGGGVVLPLGVTSGSFGAPDGTQFVAQVSGSAIRLLIDVHARESIQAVTGAAFHMRSWYLLSLLPGSCTILQGDASAWIEGNIPLAMSVSKGSQSCSIQPGRHLF